MVGVYQKILSIIVLFIVIVSIDYLFFRNLFWERLIANIAIFLVFLVVFIKYIDK
jgi:hypothetical protein